MRAVYGYIPLMMVLLAGLIALAFFKPIDKWFRSNRAAAIGTPIGVIAHVEGSVRRLHGEDIEVIPINLALAPELRDGDKIQTSYASKADIVMSSGAHFEVPAFSGVQFNLRTPGDEKSDLYVHVLFGSLTRDSSGASADHLYIIEKGKLYPGRAVPAVEMLGLSIKAADAYVKNDLPDMPAVENRSSEPAAADLTPESLSLEYINDLVFNQRDRLRNCWLAFLKGATGTGNHMQVDFAIQNSGAVHDVKIAKSSIADEVFTDCVQKIFARLSFQPFNGPPVSATFPLEFE